MYKYFVKFHTKYSHRTTTTKYFIKYHKYLHLNVKVSCFRLRDAHKHWVCACAQHCNCKTKLGCHWRNMDNFMCAVVISRLTESHFEPGAARLQLQFQAQVS